MFAGIDISKKTNKNNNKMSSLELTVAGDREVIDAIKAKDIVTTWIKTKIQKEKETQKKVIITKVVLSGKSYTVDAADVIADFIRDVAPNVKIAILSDIIASRPEEEGLAVLKIICYSFFHSALEEVDLSDNALGSKGISACDSVLSFQKWSLKKLSLCNNGLSATAMQEVADILCGNDDETDNSNNICSRLTSINFFNNMSGNGGCSAFARILSKCTTNLTHVRFSSTRAGNEGSMIIASALEGLGESLINIEYLDLMDNSFKSNGGAVLARALRLCPNLKYLNLRDCILDDDATGFICHAIWAGDAPLEFLDVSGNELTKKSAKYIADIMEEGIGGTLKVLHCEENELTSRGVSYIADKLPPGIQEIRLGFNECGSIGAQALIKRYSSDNINFSDLKLIHLDGNMFPDNNVQLLQETFGDLLPEMEDNDDEDDIDADLEDESDDDDEEEVTNDAVAELAEKVKGLDMQHSIC